MFRSNQGRRIAIIAAFTMLLALFTPISSPADAAQTSFSCVAQIDGTSSTVSFSGRRAGSENLLVDDQWVATTTGLNSFVTTTGQSFVVRLRGRGYNGPNGYQPVRCTKSNSGDYTCSFTTGDGSTEVRMSGDRGFSENLLIDGEWVQSVTGQSVVTVSGNASQVQLRLRGNGWTGPNGYQDIGCTTTPVTGTYECSFTSNGNTTVRFGGDRAFSENLLIDSTWRQTVTGREQTTVGGNANRVQVRLRGNGYSGPNGYLDVSCSGGPVAIELAPLEPADGVLFGAYPSPRASSIAGSKAGVASFEAATQTSLDIVQVFNPPHEPAFRYTLANHWLERDKIPLITFRIGPDKNPAQAGGNVAQQVIDGQYDDQIRARAAEAKLINGPFFARLFHEADGKIGKLYDINKVGSPNGDIRKYWQRVRDIFDQEGVTNIVWVWNVASFNPGEEGFYPGDDLVDWIGADPYQWIGDDGAPRCQRGDAYAPLYDKLGPTFWNFAANHPDKPIMLGEWGAGYRNDPALDIRAQFIESARDAIEVAPRLKALLYFNSFPGEGNCDWRLELGPAAGRVAYRELANDPAYYVNVAALINSY